MPWLRSARWSSLPPAPIAGRQDAATAWTGTELLVWGGIGCPDGKNMRVYDDGAVYNPALKTWTPLPASPLAARYGAIAIWTGRVLFVYGGAGADSGGAQFGNGALYDPVTRRWTPVSSSPLGHVDAATPVGPDVYFFGGPRSSAPSTSGNDDHPAVMTVDGARSAVWTGAAMVRATGSYSHPRTVEAWDPSSGAWQQLAKAPHDVANGATVWTGRELLYWGATTDGTTYGYRLG